MSEQKEICPKCGSVDFGILRDMTSRRVCKCGHGWDAPEKKYISPHLLVHKELWNQVSERYDKLKSDYDALKQLNDAFYLKQVQLENQNEDIKAKLEKAVEALKEISKYTSAYSGASSPEANLAKETLRELGVEK